MSDAGLGRLTVLFFITLGTLMYLESDETGQALELNKRKVELINERFKTALNYNRYIDIGICHHVRVVEIEFSADIEDNLSDQWINKISKCLK